MEDAHMVRVSDRVIEKIEDALYAYQSFSSADKATKTNAGVDILRWASKGFIEPLDKTLNVHSVSKEMFAWYPRHQGFLILRFAKRGMLQVNKQEVMEYFRRMT